MSIKLLKSGHYKCVPCDITFKNKEAADKHLKTPGHKARKDGQKSKNSSMLSTTSKAKGKVATSRMDDSILSSRSLVQKSKPTSKKAKPPLNYPSPAAERPRHSKKVSMR